MTAEEFDQRLNDIYASGYHDGAFPKEPSYSEQFNEMRTTMLVHDAELRASIEAFKTATGAK